MNERTTADGWRALPSRIEANLVPRLRAFSESPEMLAIRVMLPWSFIGLAIGLVAFMIAQPSGDLLRRFSLSFGAAFGVMSVLLVLLLTWDLARRRQLPALLATAIAAAAFAASLPYAKAKSGTALAQALGSSGLFLAMGITFATVGAMRLGRARFGARAGYAAAALVVVGVAVALASAGISLTAALDRLIAPLGLLGDSLAGLLIIVFLETLLWTVGIHGPALLAAVILPVYINLQIQNSEAFARGEPLPHIVTVSLFLLIFPGGAGATLPVVVLLLRSKVKRLRTIAYATLVPSLFNANEPLMFGLPMVLNPILAVPFIVTPLVLSLLTYFTVSLGLVERPVIYIPSTFPVPLGAYFATKGDWRAAVLALVDLAVAFAIYAPFVAIFERHERERESATPAA